VLAEKHGIAATSLAALPEIVVEGERAFFAPRLAKAERDLVAFVDAFHQRYSARDGASVAACRDAVGGAALFEAALTRLQLAGTVEAKLDCVRRCGFDAMQALSVAEREYAEHLEGAFRVGGLTPPDVAHLIGGDTRREAVYRLLVARGRLIRIGGPGGRPVVFHREAVDRALHELVRAFPPPAQFTVAQARERLRSTRKFVVPLLEFLDASRFTRRAGDVRSLLRPA
jgi:selenocysteine-specific elongation factor